MRILSSMLEAIAMMILVSIINVAKAQDSESGSTVTALPSSQTVLGTGLKLYASALPLDKADPKNFEASLSSLRPERKLSVYCSAAASSGLSEGGENLQFGPGTNQSLLIKCENSRFLSASGGIIRVYLVEQTNSADACQKPAMLPELKVEEVKRKTLIAVQIKQVITAIAAGPVTPTVCAWAWPDLVLTEDRAYVSIGIASPSNPPSPAVAKVTTGSAEHMFLSADGLVKGASQIKYNAAESSAVHKDKPNAIYLGFNYMIGDVHSRLPIIDARRLVVKAMFQPNKRPFDSVGIGLGYRFADIFSSDSPGGKDNSGFVLFVGNFWTKPEDQSGNSDRTRKASTRIGLSYSIGTALDWLKDK